MTNPEAAPRTWDRRRFVWAAAIIAGLTVIYYILCARGYFSGKYFFAGDTYSHWSVLYFALYSLKHFGEFPWWDPSIYNGYPLYFQVLSGPHAWFAPLYLPSFGLFYAASFLGASINDYIVFQRTIYFFILNTTAVYLISRELIARRAAVVFPPLIFSLCYMQLFNFHDVVVYEALAAPLFYIYALIYHNNRRTRQSFFVLALCAGVMLGSLNYAFLMSAFFWTTIVTILTLIFFPDLVKDTWGILRDLWVERRTRAAAFFGAGFIFSGAVASVSSLYLNFGQVIRYRGGKVDYSASGGFSNHPIPLETSDIWTMLMNWVPFSDLHNYVLRFAYHGHDHRYIGLLSLCLVLAAMVLCYRNRYVLIFGMTYLICNLFIIYTGRNLAYTWLTDNLDILRNTRNMLSMFPRGGPILFLVFIAGIGLDAILAFGRRKMSELDEDESRTLTLCKWLLAGLTVLGILCLARILFYWGGILGRHSFAHIGVYLILFSLICQLLLRVGNITHQRWIVGVLAALVFMEMTVSLSHHIDRKLAGWDDMVQYGYYCRVAADKHPQAGIPDTARFRPITDESQNMFGDYIGVYHTSWEVVWGMKPWLTLHSREQWRPLLENWNASTRKMKEYPAFRYYTNGYYVPLDTMAKLDENDELLGKKPLFFLHDQALVNATAPEALDGKTEILAYTPNRAVVRTTTAQDGFLCFLDNYEKFWTATLDGAPIDIARANFSFKAIPLPKGTHTVEWVYNPYPVKIVYILYYTLFGLFIAWCAVMFREKSWEWGPVPPRV